MFLLKVYAFSLYIISISTVLGSQTDEPPFKVLRTEGSSSVSTVGCSTETLTHPKKTHEFAKATTDVSFKQLLDPTKDKEVIISFLNTFVPQFAKDSVEYIEPASVVIPALPRDGDRKEKATFMDLHVKSKSGASYIIEMQARRHIYFDERALFYCKRRVADPGLLPSQPSKNATGEFPRITLKH